MILSGRVIEANLGFETITPAARRTFEINLQNSLLKECLTLGK